MSLHEHQRFPTYFCRKQSAAFDNFSPVGSQQFRSGTRRRCPEIRHEIRDRKINLMSHRADNRNQRFRHGPRHNLFVKFPEILNTPATPCHDNHIDRTNGVGGRGEPPDRSGNLVSSPPPLHTDGMQHHPESRMAAMKHIQKVPDGCTGRGGDNTDAPWKTGQRLLSSLIEEPLGSKTSFEFLKAGLEDSFPRTRRTMS